MRKFFLGFLALFFLLNGLIILIVGPFTVLVFTVAYVVKMWATLYWWNILSAIVICALKEIVPIFIGGTLIALGTWFWSRAD